MKVEIFEGDGATPMMVGEFSQVPRVGEHLSIDRDGYFQYYNVVEVWHRADGDDVFHPCVRIELDD